MKLNLETLDVTSFPTAEALPIGGDDDASYPHICPTPTTTTGIV